MPSCATPTLSLTQSRLKSTPPRAPARTAIPASGSIRHMTQRNAMKGTTVAGRLASLTSATVLAALLLSACSTDGPGQVRSTPSGTEAASSPTSAASTAAASEATPTPTASGAECGGEGCDPDPEAEADPDPDPDPVADPDLTEVDDASTTFFQSPSGNIVCSMARTGAVCEIAEHTFSPPTKPSDCELDYGTMISAQATEPASFVCHGDTAFGHEVPVLHYGQRMTNGLFLCSSTQAGMACSTIDGSHGFELSRAAYRLY